MVIDKAVPITSHPCHISFRALVHLRPLRLNSHAFRSLYRPTQSHPATQAKQYLTISHLTTSHPSLFPPSPNTHKYTHTHTIQVTYAALDAAVLLKLFDCLLTSPASALSSVRNLFDKVSRCTVRCMFLFNAPSTIRDTAQRSSLIIRSFLIWTHTYNENSVCRTETENSTVSFLVQFLCDNCRV